jgi:hypothetical protein
MEAPDVEKPMLGWANRLPNPSNRHRDSMVFRNREALDEFDGSNGSTAEEKSISNGLHSAICCAPILGIC